MQQKQASICHKEKVALILRVPLPESCFHSPPRAKASHPTLRQVVHMRHLLWMLQRCTAFWVSADLLALLLKRLKFKGV